MEKRMRVVWGIGILLSNKGAYIKRELKDGDIIIDDDPQLWGGYWCGYPICSPNALEGMPSNIIIITDRKLYVNCKEKMTNMGYIENVDFIFDDRIYSNVSDASRSVEQQINSKVEKTSNFEESPKQQELIPYDIWRMRYAKIDREDLFEMRESVAAFQYKPLISIVMPVYNPTEEYFRMAIDSVLGQSYPYWELCVADDASPDPMVRSVLSEYAKKDSRIHVVERTENGHISVASNSAIELVHGDFIALMDHDDILSPEALFCVVYELEKANGELDLIYSDEDKVDGTGRCYDPYFKPDWNERLIYEQNYVAHLGVYRSSLVREIGGFRAGFEGSQDYDLLLRFLKKTESSRICHIPRVLYHWRIFQGNHTFSTDNMDISDKSAYKALKENFEGTGVSLEDMPSFPGVWNVTASLPRNLPLISIIIPTRDHTDVLRVCLSSIFERTDYPRYEVIVVDNGSEEKVSLKYFSKISKRKNVCVIRDDSPFNYSSLNNLATRKAKGEYFLFLNNDIKIRENNWLTELFRSICWPQVGVVGAKLLYENDTVQHAGVTVGIYGVAGHSGRHLSEQDVGYFGHMKLERETSAVTGACMLVSRAVFDKVKGFDEENLSVSYNDVDICLKIREAGLKIVYNPNVCLYHLESISRGADETKEQKDKNRIERHYMYEKYGNKLLHDPYYSPHLALENEDYQIALWPRVGKPWRPWLEFVCPFHRGDVLLGLQVAYLAHLRGVRLRMHVSEDLIPWIADFHCPFPVDSVPVGIPKPKDTHEWFNRACDHVSHRPSSSGHIVGSHPQFDFSFLGLNIVENLLHSLGLSIDSKLKNFKPEPCPLTQDDANILNKRTVLLHPNGGWKLKSLPDWLVNKIITFLHENKWRVVQIGGPGDKKMKGVDGTILRGEGTGYWRSVFERAGAIVGVDSWSSHFAAIVDTHQITFYGSTCARDVCSRTYFKDDKSFALIVDTIEDCAPCNLFECKKEKGDCKGYNYIDKDMEKFFKRLDSYDTAR